MSPGRLELTVGWGDCDPARIVFYPRYFRWFEAATLNLLAGLGLGLPVLADREGLLRMPVVDCGATFYRPSRFGDRLAVESVLETWGRSSFRVGHTVFNGGEQALIGHEVRVWVAPDDSSPGGLRAVPLPATVISRFRACET